MDSEQSWLAILTTGFTVFLKGNWTTSGFFAAYVTLLIFAVCWVGWKFAKKTKWIPLGAIDFTTGRRQLDEMEEQDKVNYKPESRWERFTSVLF